MTGKSSNENGRDVILEVGVGWMGVSVTIKRVSVALGGKDVDIGEAAVSCTEFTERHA